MFAFAPLWAAVIAVLLATGLFVTMLAARRPEGGWRARVRDVLVGERGRGAGVVAEHRAAAVEDGVGLAELFDGAERESGYVTVPEAIESRLEGLADALTERVRTGRSHG